MNVQQRPRIWPALFTKALMVGLVGAVAAGACASGATVLSTNSIADAFVTPGSDGSLSTSNFGAAGALALAAPGLPQGEFQTVLKFNLSGITSSLNAIYGTGLWTVQSVSLQLTASPHNNAIFNNIAAGQFNISLMQNNSWVEGTGSGGIPTSDGISFSTLQSTYINNATDQALGTFNFAGGSSGTATYSLNLSSSLISDLMDGNDLSLRLFAADDAVSYLFSSRSGGSTSTRPTLVIDVVPEPSALAICALALAAFSIWRLGLAFKKN
jgi:hypothetical protein